MRLGSGEQGEYTFLDIISIISFVVGLQNLELNITQESLDKQTAELKEQVDNEVSVALAEIHSHLEMQDDNLHLIMERLGLQHEDN